MIVREIAVAVTASLATALMLWIVGAIGHLPAVVSVPSGAVIAFNADACPARGWREYQQAYGRFVRGIDKSGDEIDPDGERRPGSIQSDALKSHSHTTVIMIGDARIDGVDSTTTESGDHHNQERPTGLTGGEEGRPKNVALLYCERQ